MSGISVRVASRGDIAGVDALLARAYPAQLAADYPPSVLVTAVPIISRARPELVVCGTYYVAVGASGEIVGAGGWTRKAPGSPVADIRHVVTDHRYLRQGIARAVFDRIFADAAAAGIIRFDCMATVTAVPFYQAMGFVALAQADIPLAPGISFPAISMRRV